MLNDRVNKLRQILVTQNLDALFISDYYNIFYITGFQTLTADERAAFSLVTQNNIYLFTDSRYYNKSSKIKTQISKLEYKIISPEKSLIYHLQEIISQDTLNRVGFEADDLRFLEYKGLSMGLSHVSFVPTEKIIIKLREIKNNIEIVKIKTASQIADLCLKEIIPTIKLGTTEKEIAFKIEFYLKSKNWTLAFEPIIAIDESSSIPHYNTKEGNGKVRQNSVILIDMGAKYENYLTDISRTIFFGKPKDEIINTYLSLLKAQKETVANVSHFQDPRLLDQFCRTKVNEQKLPNYPHSTGHGVGLEIHEYPKISSNSVDALQTNQIFTIEPGVYIPHKFGIRIEDTVLLKDSGVEVLTQFPKDPYFF